MAGLLFTWLIIEMKNALQYDKDLYEAAMFVDHSHTIIKHETAWRNAARDAVPGRGP